MKKLFLFAILASLIIFVSSALAAGSVTISSQVLDSSIRPGGETTVILTLSNPSTTTSVTSIRLSIIPGTYLTPSTNYVEIGGLDASASQQTSVTVKANPSATSSISYIKAEASYYVGTTEYKTTANIPIKIRRIPILQVTEVQYKPSLIEPGNKVALYFNLKNEGDGPANDIKINLNQTTEKFIVDGSPETFIDSIDPKESKSVSFNVVVDPSVEVGTYSIPITLSYSDETKTVNYTDTKYIGLSISGEYNFVITPSQKVVAPGRSSTVDLEIANGGNQKALYLTMNILPSNPIVQVTPTTKYIGNLASDDYDSEQLTFSVADNTAPGVYPLNVLLSYKDSYGKAYNETFQVDIKVSSLKDYTESNNKISPIGIIITVIILGVIGFFIYRKFFKKKK